MMSGAVFYALENFRFQRIRSVTNATAEQTQSYIDTYYVTRSELAKLAGLSEDRIVELADAKCIPPHAYEVRSDMEVVSSFGSYTLPSAPRYYYHPRSIEWIEHATSLAEHHPLDVVAEMIKTKFSEDIDKALAGRPLPWPDGKDRIWDYLMDGTWSLCLKNYNVPDLVQKEVARATIARIAGSATTGDISDRERAALEEAVSAFDEVALPFSPHEVGESSRCLEVNAVVKQFGLSNGSTSVAAE